MQTKNNYATGQSPVITFLIVCGAIGPLLFILVFLIEGATRPGYSAWRNYVSSLSLSDQGWLQIANFLVCGLLSLCFAVGLRQVLRSGRGSIWGPLLLGLFGLGLIVAGLFVTDPSLGYPPGTHGGGPQTLHGTVHGLAGLIVFSSLAAASFVLARRFAGDPNWKGWAPYSIITGVLVVVFFIASTVASVLDARGILPGAPTGLLQRISIFAGWGWIALFAIRLLGKMQSSVSAHRDAVETDAAEHPGTLRAGE
jgi:Protein of unknown function (DUF998)